MIDRHKQTDTNRHEQTRRDTDRPTTQTFRNKDRRAQIDRKRNRHK